MFLFSAILIRLLTITNLAVVCGDAIQVTMKPVSILLNSKTGLFKHILNRYFFFPKVKVYFNAMILGRRGINRNKTALARTMSKDKF